MSKIFVPLQDGIQWTVLLLGNPKGVGNHKSFYTSFCLLLLLSYGVSNEAKSYGEVQQLVALQIVLERAHFLKEHIRYVILWFTTIGHKCEEVQWTLANQATFATWQSGHILGFFFVKNDV